MSFGHWRCSLFLALAMLAVPLVRSQESITLPELQEAIAELPSPNEEVDSCEKLVTLANRLIAVGPEATRELLEAYLGAQPRPDVTEMRFDGGISEPWGQVLVLMALLIDGDYRAFGDLHAGRVHYEDGLILQEVLFLWGVQYTYPRQVCEDLATVHWELFRKEPVKLDPSRATDKTIRDFLEKHLRLREANIISRYSDSLVERVRKQTGGLPPALPNT